MPDVTLPAAAPSSSKINAAAYTVVHDHTHTHTHTIQRKTKSKNRRKGEANRRCETVSTFAFAGVPASKRSVLDQCTDQLQNQTKKRKKERTKKKKGKKEGEKTKVTRGT